MPEISRFLGIVVAMFYSDHAPPRIHVRYGGHKATIAIDPPALLEGALPPRALGLVVERATLHRAELLADWARARAQQPLLPAPPLE
jgi:predicted pyridoxine 5'-phosphate oxidase superfamily flavin-nucleotide-binding protein